MTTLIERARQEGTPVIEGATATFVFHGAEPPVLRGDFNGWNADRTPEWQQHEAGVWTIRLSFADDAYVEYCLGTDETRLMDPFNARRVSNGMGKYNNYFYMPQGGPTPYAARRRNALAGAVTRYDVATHLLVAGRQRRVDFFQPPVDGPVPLVLVYDGPDYNRRASLTTVVDNLIAARRIRPIAMALVANGRDARTSEYGSSEGTLVWLQELVLPLARQHLSLVDVAEAPGAYGVMGASMGGLMAVTTALRLSGTFGRVLSQSGAFHFGGYAAGVVDLVRYLPVLPLKLWMDVGRYEWLLQSNRDMHALLQARGYDVIYHEYNGGHAYVAWRDDLVQGLQHLFPPES